MRAIMSVSGWVLLGIMVVVASVAVAWPAHADPDTDFANQLELHTYGIYGQKDYRYKSAFDKDRNLSRRQPPNQSSLSAQ